MASSALGTNNERACGIFTKTIIRSPVVRWILYAQVRHPACNDAVFVGEDFVEVKEVGKNGHLQQVAIKEDFEARIIAAAVFNTDDDDDESNFMAQIKQEASQDDHFPQQCPPQLVILTLDSTNLVFLALKLDENGVPRFVQCIVPLPHFDRTLFQPGSHLAVDPFSRAVAVAAREDQIVLYGTKSKEQLKYELTSQPSEFCPISSARPFKVDGVIQQMDFLTPPSTSSDQVILLLIIIRQGRTKAARIEWSPSLGPRHAQLHAAQALHESETVPSLLIPLRDAAFFLISDNNITLYKDILSGSATDVKWSLPEDDAHYPGISSRSPAWASWAKPQRSKAAAREKDEMYLVREDGLVIWITVKVATKSTLNTSRAGDLECHVGTAFASLGDEGGPDILAVAGETCSGRTVSIGSFFTPRRIEEMSREKAMSFEIIEGVPNWASATDMISTKQLHANRHQTAHTDNVLVTSGRQPYGSVTEIRRGLEGRVLVGVPLQALSSTSDVWAIPDRSMGHVVLVLSSPMGTRLLHIEGDCEAVSEIHDKTAFDLDKSTLNAGLTASGHLVQVTSHGFCVTGTIHGNFEDTVRRDCDGSTTISAADILAEHNILITAEEDGIEGKICCYGLTCSQDESDIQLRESTSIAAKILSVAAIKIEGLLVVVASTADGAVTAIIFNGDQSPRLSTTSLPPFSTDSDAPSVCDHVAILQSYAAEQPSDSLLVACGLRDGRIVTYQMQSGGNQTLFPNDMIAFGDSTVKLVALNNDKRATYAFSGASTCLLSWDGNSTSVENIWLADKAQPDMPQPSVIACAQTPPAIWLSSGTMADLLVAASEDELYFAAVQPLVTTVPRQILVDGTPNRLLHAESLRSIVCSTLYAEVQTFPSSRPRTAPEERRQIWPIIHFIPSGKGNETPYQHHMLPGDRVNALLEWSYRSRTSNKAYTFVLVGGKHRRQNGDLRGRVTFLQLSIRNWKIESVTDRFNLDFADEVYALAQLDDRTIVVCAGELVYYYAYREENNSWQRIPSTSGRDSIRIASPGLYVTVEREEENATVAISTARDSLVVLDGASGDTVAMGPHAQNLLCHQVIADDSALTRRLALVSTKDGEISGLSWSSAGNKRNQATQVEFTAQLPHSLTRLVPSTPSARKGLQPEGVVSDRVVGCATDGALVGITLIDQSLWRRLSWLQRLIEWSPVLSPHALDEPMYDRGNESGMTFPERGMPIGLAGRESSAVVPLQARNRKENDLHIDGDVLGRALENGEGVQEVRNVMTMLASETEHAIGRWMMEHLDEEMEALEEVVRIVKGLERWM